MSEVLAKMVLTTGDNGLEVSVDSELDPGELAEILHVVADQMAPDSRPRAADSWGYKP